MARRTYKVGITRKYGTRYGASLRKIIKKFEVAQHARYLCPFCGKVAVRRRAIGIWSCKACHKVIAGGAWELATSQALTAKTTMLRLKKMREDAAGNAQQEEELAKQQAEAAKKSESKKEGKEKKAAGGADKKPKKKEAKEAGKGKK